MHYTKRNYILIALSVALILGGFVLMSGGGSSDPNTFDPAIFSSGRTRVAPIICLSGFVLMIYAILYRQDRDDS